MFIFFGIIIGSIFVMKVLFGWNKNKIFYMEQLMEMISKVSISLNWRSTTSKNI